MLTTASMLRQNAATSTKRGLTIGRKLIVLFLVLLTLAAVNLWLVRLMLGNQQNVSDSRSLINQAAMLSQHTVLEAMTVVLGDVQGQQRVVQGLDEVQRVLAVLRVGGQVGDLIVQPLPETLQIPLTEVQNAWDAVVTRLTPLLQAPAATQPTHTPLLQQYNALLQDVTTVWQASRVLVDALVQHRAQSQQHMMWQMYLLLFGDALILLAAYVWMRHALVRPLRTLAAAWRKLAEGDYQTRVVPHAALDEVNAVVHAFNDSAERIGGLVTRMERDISEQKQTEEALWVRANYDALTGLANRHMFYHQLASEISRSQRKGVPMALLFLDLNLFKDVNDTYGHESGDSVLQQVSKRLTSSVREVDRVARMGGDEFTIILSELGNRSVIERICNNICMALAQPLDAGGHAVKLSASIGIALYPMHGSDGDALVRHADRAMYQAKRSNRGFMFYGTKAAVNAQ